MQPGPMPAARLENLCILNNKSPRFLFEATGQSHKPTFSITVTIDGVKQISASATDSTKKAVKHRACNMVLQQISAGVGDYTWKDLESVLQGWHYDDYESSRLQQAPETVKGEEAAEEDNFNFIGALNEYCVKQTTSKIVGPEYKDLDCQMVDKTNRIFTVECILYFVGDSGTNTSASTTGSGSTKKAAKRKAAAEMYHNLKAQGNDLSVKPILRYKPEVPAAADSPINQNISLDVWEDKQLSTTEWDAPEEVPTQSPTQPTFDEKPQVPDYFLQLKDLAVNQDLIIEVEDVSSESSGCFRCLIRAGAEHATSDSIRVACGEAAASFEAAKQTAARNLFKIIQQ